MGIKDERETVKARREQLAKFFYDMSKTTYAVMVLGNGFALLNTGEVTYTLVASIALGIACTVIFARIADKTMSNKKIVKV